MIISCLYQEGDELTVSCPEFGVDHSGLVFRVVPTGFDWNVFVIHKSKRNGGICLSSLEEFADGQPIRITRHPISEEHRRLILQRATMSLQIETGYQWFSDNCEHFTSWCYTGMPESRQIQHGVLGVGLTVLAIGLFASFSEEPKRRKAAPVAWAGRIR